MMWCAQKILPPTKVIWPASLRPGTLFPFQGKRIVLQEHVFVKNAVYQWFPAQGVLSLGQLCPQQIRLFLYQEALRQATAWAENYAVQLELAPRSITMKQTKGRWGSLGIHNDLYLNWVLIFAPAPVFQYVVLHEMGHLRYRSHGPRFWKLIERYMPHYKDATRWLRYFGSQIMPPSHLGF